ncbi:MAG: trigger factor [Myxococcales bacterium]|nr:trigger factor [Myxococcales bacterium]
MLSQLEQKSPVLVEVRIEVPWSRVNEQLEKAYRSVQKTARIRGFRPGKAPRSVIKQLVGKSVQQEVAASLVEESLGAAVDEHSLQLVAVPRLDQPKVVDGEPLRFTAEIEVRPKIEQVNLEGLTAKRPVQTVGDETVEQELQQLRERQAEISTPEPPRPAAEGDVVTLDLEVEVEGQPRPEFGSQDLQTQVGSDDLLPAIAALIPGAAVDEQRDTDFVFPDDHSSEELRGKSALFRVRIKAIQERVLPELDDEFAKDLEVDSLEALRQQIRERRQKYLDDQSERAVRDALFDALVANNPIEVPPSMVEREVQRALAELQRLQSMLGQALPSSDFFGEAAMERAQRSVKLSLLLARLAEQENMDVDEAAIEARLGEIAEQSGKHPAKVRAEYQGEARAQLANQILHQQLVELLLKRATIEDVPAGTETEAEEAKPDTDTGSDTSNADSDAG